MNIDFTPDEVRAVTAALDFTINDIREVTPDLPPDFDVDVVLVSAWLKLVRAQAAGLAVPAKVASTPAVGTTNKVVPAPMPGVTRMGAGTLSFDTWGLR